MTLLACVKVDTWWDFSMSQFLHLQSGNDDSNCCRTDVRIRWAVVAKEPNHYNKHTISVYLLCILIFTKSSDEASSKSLAAWQLQGSLTVNCNVYYFNKFIIKARSLCWILNMSWNLRLFGLPARGRILRKGDVVGNKKWIVVCQTVYGALMGMGTHLAEVIEVPCHSQHDCVLLSAKVESSLEAITENGGVRLKELSWLSWSRAMLLKAGVPEWCKGLAWLFLAF